MGKGPEEVRTMKLVASRSTPDSKRLRCDDGRKVNKSECLSTLLTDELKKEGELLFGFIYSEWGKRLKWL